jgi:hypothetical protein
MNKRRKEQHILEAVYSSIYGEKLDSWEKDFVAASDLKPAENNENPDADTYGGGIEGPFEAEQKGPNFEGPPHEDNEIEALIAADIDEEHEEREDNEDDTVVAKQGRDTTAAQFDAEEATGYA